MANKRNRTNINDERVEDSTLYGEFVSSYHQWITLDRQKNVSEHLEGVTDDEAPKNAKKTSG